MWPNSTDLVASTLVERLKSRGERLALAESCTSGMAAAIIGGVPGASNVFCGSMVTYRIASKQAWLGVPKQIIDIHSAESRATTEAMATCLLEACPEADWTAAVTGHFGPDAPADHDGEVFFCLARRIATHEPRVLHRRVHLNESQRIARQIEASMNLIQWISENIL
ncbi:CinA family protein [Neorhodopirellula pilleata]|uniref:Putative competence-damage inducible protein n=1 Tax=Neorhodopirellula pilleata TaxID=2714738 RepID=A0A5C6AG38_9BACT|nr:nicotinamide-nucleotide amidohydrolase family protein [Neorhodopirellula pilleata]TWT98934.1 putative competence-damage inducible protein [Neorhodopirellula pilleata]